jgi:hypothetical protein
MADTPPPPKDGLITSADQAAQGLGALNTVYSLVGLAVMTVVCLAGGLYFTLRRSGSELHAVDTVVCEPASPQCANRSGSVECFDGARCTLTGERFGPLSRTYREGQQPVAGQMVRVNTALHGESTLEDGAPDSLGPFLLVGAAVLAVIWLITFKLRRNRWFLRWKGVMG